MHELSIAVEIVAAVEEEVKAYPDSAVTRVMVRVGALSGCVPEALEFVWPEAAGGSRAEGARLEIQTVETLAWCPSCENETPIADASLMRCPACGEATPELRQGRELEIRAIELDDGGQRA